MESVTEKVNLFVYGTLMYPELYRAITGMEPNYQSARLQGFAVRRLHGRPYPGLMASPGAEAVGLLVSGIDEPTMRALDRYEGEEYEYQHVRILSGDESVDAVTYILRKELLYLATPLAWEPDPDRLEKC